MSRVIITLGTGEKREIKNLKQMWIEPPKGDSEFYKLYYRDDIYDKSMIGRSKDPEKLKNFIKKLTDVSKARAK